MTATIYLARHCKTAWNLEGRIQGKIDPPLSDLGVEEALGNVDAIRGLGIGRIVCSTARRAFETAQIYGQSLELPIHRMAQLRELDHGAWEGRTVSELLTDSTSGYAAWLADPGMPIPGGEESLQAAQHRVVDAIRDIALSARGETVLVVAHKRINGLLMCALWKAPLTAFESYAVDNTIPHLLDRRLLDALVEHGALENVKGKRRTRER